MIENTLIRSLGISTITGGLTEGLKILLLYYNFSIKNVLLISMIFSYSIAYVAQRHIFSAGKFFGISLLKYCAVTLVIIQITNIFLDILQNNDTIKSFIEDGNITETRRKIYKYILINLAILIIFFGIEYPLRKKFVFLKNKETDYIRSYMLYGLAAIIFLYTNNYFSGKTIDNTVVNTVANTVGNTVANTVGNTMENTM